MDFNISWREVEKLSEILDDDDFKILMLKITHPEMTTYQIENWFDKEISRSLIRYKLHSIHWKLRRLRGEKIEMQEVLREIKEKNIKNQELKKEMVDRFFQLFYETGKVRESVREVIAEYGYPCSSEAFKRYLYINYGDFIRKN